MIHALLCMVVLTVAQSDSFDLMINEGLEHSYNEEYERAKDCFDKAITMAPESPLGYFVYAGLYRIYASDFVTDSLLDSFFVYAERTTTRAAEALKKNKHNAWAYYYLGGISMYRSSVYIERGDYLRALGYAEQSMEEITRCLAIDDHLYDAYLVVGSYEYLKGSFPLWGAYKDRGIEKVKVAAEKSRYARPIAKNILALLLLREQRYDEAIRTAEELVQRYPESRTFLWTLSKSYREGAYWKEAMVCYEKLLVNILREQSENHYNLAQAKLALAVCFFNTEDYEKAIELSNEVINLGSGEREMRQMVSEAKEIIVRSRER